LTASISRTSLQFERTEKPFEFHRQFTLLVGDNGSGKTSVLDALAVALGLWHKGAPGSGWRNILPDEIRRVPVLAGDRIHFRPQLPSAITAEGKIGARENLRWTRMIREGGTRTTNAEAREAENSIMDMVQAALQQRGLLPVPAYYGAGRAWSPTSKRPSGPTSQRKSQQFDAYHNCLDTRIRDRELNEWFLFETVAANGHREGRPGFRAVKQAVLQCIPEADNLRYDSDLKEIVLSIGGFEQPFYNLSAGQRMMLAMVADIAIKAVTLNSYSYGPEEPGVNDPMYVLRNSPGVVLIDELDVHLHPKWQRRVATDLKTTFPSIQFICTSHSPQVIGEVSRDEVRLLTANGFGPPSVAFGADSNWIPDHVMVGASAEAPDVRALQDDVEDALTAGNLPVARDKVRRLRQLLDGDTGELVRLESSLESLELLMEESVKGGTPGENHP
jgi:predicted ATP-binding protein involved in virulence